MDPRAADLAPHFGSCLAASDLGHWYAADRIIELARIVVFTRPGIKLQRERLVDRFPRLAERLLAIEGPGLDISSTDLRQRVAAGLPIRYLTPDPVVEYISSQRLYQPEPPAEDR